MSRGADIDHGLICGREAVANLEREFELFVEVVRSCRRSGVFFDDELLRFGVAVDGQLNGVSSGNDLRSTDASGPEDHPGKASGIGVVKVPDETIESWFSGGLRSGRSLILFQACSLLWLGL